MIPIQHKILLIEDNDDHASLFQNALGISGVDFAEIKRATCLVEGIEFVEQGTFNIVVLDLGLPDSKGLDTLNEFIAHCQTLPIIVLTSQADLELGAEAMHLGAQDYLPKEMLSRENLGRCIRYAVERHSHVIELEEKHRLLQISFKEKEALLKEIHHRVKNNMQVISSLLKLQSRTVDRDDVRKMFDETRERVAAMSLVHERLYQSESLSRIDIGEYTATLANSLFRNYVINSDRIKLELRTEKVHLPIDKAVPFGLLLNELISNALKHGFPEGAEGSHQRGKIIISLALNSHNEIELVVEDNGVGLPEGFELEHVKSMGMDLVRVLTKQLAGTLEYFSDEGARFCLYIPLSETAIHLIDR